MARHDDKGTVKIGSKTIQQGSKGTSSPPPSSTQSRRVKDVQQKNLEKTKREINEAIEKRQKDLDKQANIKDDGILAGIGFRGQDVDRTVEKENYKDPRKHKLRNQFDYLTDKYYGGDAKAFAKTSQGQALLGYLSGVSADRGGGRGGDVGALQAGAPTLFKNIQGLKSPRDLEFIYNRPIASDIRNLSAQAVKDNLKDYASRTGITGAEAFNRFNQALQVAAPDAYGKARPFSSGQGIGNLIEQGAGFVPGLGLASRFIGGLLPQRATGGLSPDEYLSQDLFKNLPMDERVDTGGVNDVAQSIINNQAPVLPPEEDVVTINPEDMVLPGFGIDPPVQITQPFLPGQGITPQLLTGFDLTDTLRLLADRGIFSPTTVT